MRKKEWAFLSNHGRVMAYVARHHTKTTQAIAQDVGLSIRGVQHILDELQEQGYIERKKVGRCNEYTIHTEMPLRHRFDGKNSIGALLKAVGAISGGGIIEGS